jgi:Fe2+ transport system protein FeoA
MTLHGSPTAAELVESVREWLERDVLPTTDGRTRFHARVAANVLAMVERELLVGTEQEIEHRERLVSLGLTNDAELAAAIRDGSLDARLDEVREVLRADVAARLAVANPTYAEG